MSDKQQQSREQVTASRGARQLTDRDLALVNGGCMPTGPQWMPKTSEGLAALVRN